MANWIIVVDDDVSTLKLAGHFLSKAGFRVTALQSGKLALDYVKEHGVPDLFLPYPCGDFHGLYIEMKAENGVLRATQRDWLEWLREQGYAAYVCHGAEAAINYIKMYLEGKNAN